MKKTILTVFLVLAVLVLIFLVWELFFADKGIMHSAYNAVAEGINQQWAKVAGEDDEILPMWDGGSSGGTQENTSDDSDGGLGIDIATD